MPIDLDTNADAAEQVCQWYRGCGLASVAVHDGSPKLTTDASLGAVMMPGTLSRAVCGLLAAEIPEFCDRLWGNHVALVVPGPDRISPPSTELLTAHAVAVIPHGTRVLLPRTLTAAETEESWVNAPAPGGVVPSLQLLLALIRECVPALRTQAPTS
ncbi:hypothetical protein [Nocardia terpenica]|uniref:Uncharacterized protein n=1 Tax=Nocardia terpenica TaxID=455432 RepID=A0A161WQD2_9NOCA|nr:hypothetical protein [Nocardia terpenica]KZM75525.1 hypothetical protein AWN90_19300 [Nocardia terpenica]NQE86006.1 hypothetical protein [Nocardia terpenica]